MSQSETQGKKAENWVKDFAQQYRILDSNSFSLEKVVPLLEGQLQYKLTCARPHVRQEFGLANEWIDSIISSRRVSENAEEKVRLAEKLLDLCVATDALLRLRDNRGKEHLIAVDVASNPTSEQEKLDIIRGKSDPKDSPGFNRNQNIAQVRQTLGITKHLILVINPDNPPERERLLNAIYAFGNQPAKTGSINLWSPAPEHSQARQQEKSLTQTPQELWHKYSQEVTTNSDIKRQAAITEKALKDGLAAKLPEILACDPFVQKVQREQGPQIARKHIQTVIRAVSTKLEASKQSQRSPKQEKRRDLEAEL